LFLCVLRSRKILPLQIQTQAQVPPHRHLPQQLQLLRQRMRKLIANKDKVVKAAGAKVAADLEWVAEWAEEWVAVSEDL
jgi:hypothetical protein